MKSATLLAFVASILLSVPVKSQDIGGGRTYVLVHGARSSIAAWYQLEPLLSDDGNRVYLASLTGHGIRRHLQSPDVDLETHILDVVNLIEVRDLTNIYLVGSSYGGMVITGVWDRARERIKHIVYVDAFIPKDGEAVSDLNGEGALERLKSQAAGHNGLLISTGRRASLPNPPSQSLMTMIQPISFTNGPLPEETLRTYIRAIGNDQQEPSRTFAQFAEQVRDDPDWNYFEIETGHGVARDDPAGLAQILLGLD